MKPHDTAMEKSRPRNKRFPGFPRLPAEIRQHIWRLCLPSRVVDFDALDSRVSWETREEWSICVCPREAGLRANQAPPLIMRVCREAYDVAVRYGAVDRTGRLETWLQPGLDRILFVHFRVLAPLWYGAYDASYEGNRYNVRKLAEAFAWARRLGMPMAVYHLNLYPFGFDAAFEMMNWQSDILAPQIALLTEFARLGRHQQFPCAIRTVVLHATRRQAAGAGLFGRLGDAACQLVDMADEARIRAYYEFWKASSPYRPKVDQAMAGTWDDLLNRCELEQQVQDWLAKTYYTLLSAVWITASEEWPEEDTNLSGAHSPPFVRPADWTRAFPRYGEHAIVETHPWVMETRSWLPTLVPYICFRVCYDAKCIWESRQSRKKDAKTGRAPLFKRLRNMFSTRPPSRGFRRRRRMWIEQAKKVYCVRLHKIPPSVSLMKNAMKSAVFKEEELGSSPTAYCRPPAHH